MRAGLAAGLLAALLTLPAACEARRPSAAQRAGDRPLVLASTTVIADMARQVAGDRLRVASITKVGSEIHAYEPTPSDLRGAQGARLILTNGFDLERWAERFIANVPGARRVEVAQGIEPLPIRRDGLRDETPPGAARPNPHAWMSPRLAQRYVDTIAAAFSQLDPAGAAGYRRRAAAYRQQLAELDGALRRALAPLPAEHRLLVSCEGAFSYLARDYGLEEAYLWPVNGEGEATPRRQAQLIAAVRRRRVPAVFCESTVSPRAMQQVAAASGARFGGTFFVDSLSLPSGPAPSLLQLQRHNVDLIVRGLTDG